MDASCSDESDFVRRLRERTLRVERAAPDEPGERVAIRVRRSDDAHITGELDIIHEGESPRTRRVEGSSCDEVIDTLSLALALAYDPEALLSPPPPREELAPGPPAIAPPAPSPPYPVPVERWRWKLGAHGTTAVTRIRPIGIEVFADVARPRAHAPSARLGLTARTGDTNVGVASASFLSAFATPTICPVRLGGGPLDLAPCAGIELGVFSATQQGATDGQSFLRPWVAPRASVLAAFAASTRLSLEAQASLEVPLVRGHYVFGTVHAYEIPVVMPALAIGITVALD